MGTSKQILDEYGFNEPAFSRLTTDAAHCGFDPLRFSGDRRQAHQEVCEEFGWDDAAKVILFVGRLDGAEVEFAGRRMSHKNPRFALEVARLCLEQDPNVSMILAGDGQAKRAEFEAQVAQWGLDQKIRLVGARHDIERLMLGSDLLLFPSLAEGLGMVVVEAQAAGLPVLASDTTPREAVVVPGMVDFVSLSAEPATWARAVLERIGEACDAAACNEAVRRSAFSIENSAMKLLSLYSA
jgi:glycosyltransferase involved in cell wall biosynthesis